MKPVSQHNAFTDSPLTLPENDYVSPGLITIMPDAAFPDMIVGDTSIPRWPYLRQWVGHNWYTDRRNPDVGFASRDEASILYNSALLFRGKSCLEVGCWRGWSAVHLALGSGMLDMIDPVFADSDFAAGVAASCRAAGVLDKVTFHAGFSPDAIDALAQSTGKRWSLIFIDADHEGDAPRIDAEAAIRNAADTAMVLFHDLASPYVAAGLHAMRTAGWRTMVYQTMQIMGVAWRGNVEPVAHVPDPKVFWTLPRHLSSFQVSGWKQPPLPTGGATCERWNAAMMAAMMRAQAAEDDLLTAQSERDAAIARALVAESRALVAEARALVAERERDTAQRVNANATLGPLGRLVKWALQKSVLLGLLWRSTEERQVIVLRKAEEFRITDFVTPPFVNWLCRRRVLLKLLRRSGRGGAALLLRELRWPQNASASGTRVQRAGNPLRENIIIVVHETSRTGAPILGWNIAQHLAQRYNVFTVTLGGGALKPEFEALSIEVHEPFSAARRDSQDIADELRPLFTGRVFKYAIINSIESRWAIEVCARHSVPTLLLMHEFASYVSPLASLRAAFDRATEIVFPAPIVARSSLHAVPTLPNRKVHIEPQGMSLIPASNTVKKPPPSNELEALSKERKKGAFVVIGAGSVNIRKGVDLFISVAAAVQRLGPKRAIRFIWVGDGYRPNEDMGYSVYLKEQVERSGLEAVFTFIEEVSDLEPIYELAHAFLLTSRLDPLPNVSIDAAHRGIPIICFRDASGTADLMLTDRNTAIGVVAHLDPAAAADLIGGLASDEQARMRMADATKKLARTAFDMKRYVERLDALGTAASARGVKRRVHA
jgi:glycosyltransferase involved in cell wall biosynthesis/predicted O-methyltransferase YrrM